jgi:Beta/Gamma crystallin
MKKTLKSALTVAILAVAAQAAAQVTFYERERFDGRSFTTEGRVGNFERYGFNDRASSVVVLRDRWETCADTRFEGRCVVLRPGRYPSLAAMGMNDRVSSVRPVERSLRVTDERYAPLPVPIYDNHRRPNERLYEAEVTSVRAVLGRPEQRCWVEREQVSAAQEPRGDVNVGAAIVGAVLGGETI